MTDSTNNSFEEQWQHAFDNAELTPPESVWEKIELGLNTPNVTPSKPNFGNKPYYFLGGTIVGLLSIFLWINNDKKSNQVVEKERIIIKKPAIVNNDNISKKAVEIVDKNINYAVKPKVSQKVVEGISKDTNHEPEEYKVEQSSTIFPQATITEQTSVKTLTDSVEMIETLTTKSIRSEIENPTLNLPIDQTPYYVKPTPKTRKKSILKNVKISVGAGVYQ